MTDYYVPLSAILGTSSIEQLLARIPLIGNALSGALEEAARQIGVRSWRETWNDRDVTVRGTAIWGHGDLTWDLGAFSLGIGRPVGDTAEFDFEFSSDRTSLLTTLTEAGEELAPIGDLSTAGGKAKVLFRADAPSLSFRLVLRGLNLRVRLAREHVRKGRVVNGADGEAYRIVPLDAASDDTAEFALAPGVLVVDSRRGVSFEFEDDQLLDVPPLLVVGDDQAPYFGILVHKLKFDLSTEHSFPEALAAGFDEAWRGIYFEELSIFNMDQLFLALPNRADPRVSTDRRSVEAKNWFIGSEGMSGYLRVTFLPDEPWTGGDGPENPARRFFQGLSFELELDRGRLVKAGGEVTLRVDGFSSDLASLGPQGNLLIGFSMRDTPVSGLFLEAVVRVAGPRDPKTQSLVALKDDLAKTFVMALALLLGLPITDLLNSMTRTLAVLFLELVIAVDWIDIKSIGLEALRIRRRPESLISGDLIWWDFSVDLKVMFGLDTPDFPLLPKLKTDPNHPITMLIHGMRYSWASNFDEFDEAELGERKQRHLGFDSDSDTGTPTNAVSFEIGDDSIVQESPLVIVKLGAGQWDRGLWLDFGVKYAGKVNDIAYSALPSLIRIYFTNAGAIDHVDVQGASFSLLVPQALFAKGEWSGGDVSKATGRALLLCKGTSLNDYKDPTKWLYNVGFGMRTQDLPPAPAPKEVTSRIVGFEFESSSGIPTVILPGTSLYGISGLYASNARPALGSDTPSVWLTQHPRAYQVDIDKWEAAQDESGWAAGVVLGAAADRARPWNLKAGFVYASPGPVLMLFGTANFLKQRVSVKDTNPAALTFYATLDLVRSEFLLGVRYDKKIPDATGRELKLSIPAELFISGHGWHLYLGQDKPAERMISAELLSKFRISGYLMFDSADIDNLGETGVDVPGFAIAVGARFAFEAGWKGSHYKLYLYSKAAFDGAVSLADPHLYMVHLLIAGGLVAKAWGLGFEFEISADFKKVWSTPDLQAGQFKISLDLPWPIPNLSLTIPLSSGQDGEGEPIVGSLVEGLTLYLRSSQTCVEFTGEAMDVPLDPVFSLAFKYPTRNEAAVPGSFNISDGSASTYYFASGDSGSPRGYAITLEGLTLYKDVGGARVVVAGPIPALWRPDPQNAAGGQPATRILELFAYQGIEASRFIGASADYVDWATQGLDRCPPAHPPEPICYVFDAVPLGPFRGELHVAQGNAKPLAVSILGAAGFAESVRRYYGLTRVTGEVVNSPIPGLSQHMLRLPASNGVTPPVHANEEVRFEFERAEQATLLVLRYPGGAVRMRGFLAQAQVAEDDTGQVLGVLGEDRFELVQYTLNGPLDRIDVNAAHGPGLRLRQSLVARVCLTDSEALREYNDQLLVAANWSDFWSDLLDQDASTSNVLLLEPGTRYTLEIQSSWAYLHEDLSLGTPHSGIDSFSFTTVPIDHPPSALRGPASALDASDWEVRTMPLDQEAAHYRRRPIRLEFRDARTDKVFGAFGKRLVLRLIDERGRDLFDRLAFLRENATDLPEYQRAWRDKVLSLPCAKPGLDVLWSTGVAHFSTLLEPALHYDGALAMLPDSVTDLASIEDWTVYPVLYHFAFKTSRYESLTAHVAAYEVFDELCEEAPDLSALFVGLGSPTAGSLLEGSDVVEAALFTRLGLLPRDPPAKPEIVRIWREGASATFELVAILLDGPEPLLRAGVQMRVKRGAMEVPLVKVMQEGGARILLLFPAAGGFGVQPTSTMSFHIDGSYLDASGVQNEIVQRDLSIPSGPATLEPEQAP